MEGEPVNAGPTVGLEGSSFEFCALHTVMWLEGPRDGHAQRGRWALPGGHHSLGWTPLPIPLRSFPLWEPSGPGASLWGIWNSERVGDLAWLEGRVQL